MLEEIGTGVTLTLAMSEVVTVAVARRRYAQRRRHRHLYRRLGHRCLTFSYTVAAGEHRSSDGNRANLNGATITDSGGNAANLH